MAVNRYDRPADAPIVNTYVPIDFNQLYRIGVTQKQAIDEAAEELGKTIQTFGTFRSPSRIDTENYYKQTLGVLRPYIEAAASDPDKMKDAGFRSAIRSVINGLNYTNLSQLQENAVNLRQRETNVAKMIADGTYNINWDQYADLANYNTLKQGVLTELAPIAYMSANQLSDAYFNNLKPTDLGQVTRNGVRYNRTGITYDTLYGIADARFNDLVRTPQGAMYYRDLLRANNNDSEAAKEAFVGMIADSQRDRLIESYDVDPAWLLQTKLNTEKPGNTDTPTQNLNRLDLINTGLTTKANRIFANRFDKLSKEDQNKIDGEIARLNQVYQDAELRYQQTGSNEDLIAKTEALNILEATKGAYIRTANQAEMLETFQKHAKFSPTDSDEYVRKNYRVGAQAALDAVSTDLALRKDDKLLTDRGGAFKEDVDAAGNSTYTYGFQNSEGFVLPETIFEGYVGLNPRETTKRGTNPTRTINTLTSALTAPIGLKVASGVSSYVGSQLADRLFSTNMAFKQMLEGGGFNSVTFTPTDKVINTGRGTLAVKGTVRIPVEEVEDKVGSGWLFSESTEKALKELYGATKVERKVGQDNVEYYQFTAYRTLPPQDGTAPESITSANMSWFNSPSNGGIGSSTLTNNNYYDTSINSVIGH